MIINVLVAILKVNLKRVATLDDFVELDEPLYAVAYLWLLFSGAGWVSVDYLASRVFGLTGCSARRPSPARTESARIETASGVTGERMA